jgi:hypothetical protein
MRNKILSSLPALVMAFAFAIAMNPNVAAQGKGRGGGAAGGRGASPGGPPSGVGVDRGLGRSSDASAGRSDDGRDNASTRSNGRSETGLERARIASQNLHDADNDLRHHPNIASDMHVNANDLRAGYQAALVTNPNLTFGNYVAATRLAQNLGGRFPAITRAAILAGLANGDSIGKTLRNLGLSSDEANGAKKRVDMQIKDSKRSH